ncbi:MAG TPA: sigma-70 family RNA polymerase sigma factor [Caulobacteraceae bacterium]|nr:sigma-70 family RNA polymerase sigma factor [Caulobacteraceae bacterium]
MAATQSGAESGAPSFRALVGPHIDAAYNLARYIILDAVAAEDVTQDALLRAYRGLGRRHGPAVKPWLLAIVRNACIDYLRKNQGWRALAPLGLDAVEDTVADPEVDDPEAVAIRRSDGAAVRRALETLSPCFREALVLRELEELSYEEIAAVTAVPIGTVMSRLSRARAQLREAFPRP